METPGAGGESNDTSSRKEAKERRKHQNTIAQRKYRNKQKEKTRELERLLSTALASANQPPVQSANTPVPESPWGMSSLFYTEQSLPQGSSYGSPFSLGMTAPFLAPAPPRSDFSISRGFSLESNIAFNMGSETSRSIKDSLSNSTPSVLFSPLQDLVPANNNVFAKDVLGTGVLYSNHDSEITSSPPLLTASQVLSFLCRDSERRSIGKIIMAEELNLRDIVKLGLAGLGATMEASQYNSANDKSAELWIKEVSSAYASCDIQLAVWTGVRVLLQMKAQSGNLQQETTLGYFPDLCTNTITLKSSPWMSASAANAEFLQIPLELLLDDNSESPLTQQSPSTRGQAVVPFQVKEITSDMTPTLEQYTRSHHPYLDLIPWPGFRSKAIIATCVTPPLIDEEDLCLDLMNGALSCWGSKRSQHGRGEGAPWDMRSWEAAPWFIEKWAMLMAGDEGEIARNSAWWRNQRGM